RHKPSSTLPKPRAENELPIALVALPQPEAFEKEAGTAGTVRNLPRGLGCARFSSIPALRSSTSCSSRSCRSTTAPSAWKASTSACETGRRSLCFADIPDSGRAARLSVRLELAALAPGVESISPLAGRAAPHDLPPGAAAGDRTRRRRLLRAVPFRPLGGRAADLREIPRFLGLHSRRIGHPRRDLCRRARPAPLPVRDARRARADVLPRVADGRASGCRCATRFALGVPG